MYIDTSRGSSLPHNNNQYNSKNPPRTTREISWRTVSEFREKISKLRSEFFVSKKDDSKEDEENERKRTKLNYTNCWDEDLTNYGYARCLRSRCNFISNNIRTVRSHYKDCDGVPQFREQNFCSICHNYLSSAEAHAEHVPICKGFNKYNQKDYKYERGLRTRKSVSKVPFDRLLGWQDQIINHGSACCGYKMCTFTSDSLAELEEHYPTCLGTAGVKTKCCAYCHFKFVTDEEYVEHRPKCLGFIRMFERNGKSSRTITATATMTTTIIENVEVSQQNVNPVQQRAQPKRNSKGARDEGEQRVCTDRHIQSWKMSLNSEKCVKCNCSFIAMSLDEMVRHFNHCNTDRNYAKVVCPYCRGRVVNKIVLREHIEKTHWTNYNAPANRAKKTSSLAENGNQILSTGVLESDQTDRIRAWQMQIAKFGYAFCMELNCNFMAKTLKELDIHVLTCKETAKKRFGMCRVCKINLPMEQLADHVSKCYRFDEDVMNLMEIGRSGFETSPIERRDLRTYSRKRKVDESLNNEDLGGWRNREGHSPDMKTEKEPKLALPEETESQVEMFEEEEDDEVQLIEYDYEKPEMSTGKTLYTLGGNEVPVVPVGPEEAEYDSDESDIQIIDEIKKVDTDEGDIPDQERFNTEIIVIDSDSEEIGAVDMVMEEEEEQEKLKSEDEEEEKDETVEIVEHGIGKVECEVEEPEKVAETVENELEGLDREADVVQNEEPERVDELDSEREEVMNDKTVDAEKDEAENVEGENEKEDAPERAVFKEVSERVLNKEKEKESEDEEDRVQPNEEMEASEKASNNEKEDAPEGVSLNNSDDEEEASKKASNDRNEEESEDEEDRVQPDDEMEASEKASNDGKGDESEDEEDRVQPDEEMEASDKEASNDGKEDAPKSASLNNSEDEDEMEVSEKASNKEKDDESEDEEMEASEKASNDGKDDESEDEEDRVQPDDEMETSDKEASDNEKEDAPKSVSPNNSEDEDEMEASEKASNKEKDDESEDEEDRAQPDDEMEASEKASNDGKEDAPESVSVNNSDDEEEASEKASNDRNEEESEDEEDRVQPDDEMEASDKEASNDEKDDESEDEEDRVQPDDEMEASEKASNDGKDDESEDEEDRVQPDDKMEASDKEASNDGKEDAPKSASLNNSDDEDEEETSEKASNDGKDDESEDESEDKSEDKSEDESGKESEDEEDSFQPDDEMEVSEKGSNDEKENESGEESEDEMEVSEKASNDGKEDESGDEVDSFQTDEEMEVSEKASNDGKEDTRESVSLNNSEDEEMEVSEKTLNEEKEDESGDEVDCFQPDEEMEVSEKALNEEKENESGDEVDSFGLDESENDQEECRMEIDEGVMSTIFETLDDDFDKCNPPYSVVGNEVEFFDVSENSQSSVIKLPNENSEIFLMNEDSGTLDRSEPHSTEGEQAYDNDQVGGNEGGDGGNDQGKSSQGVEESGGQNNDTPPDENNDDGSGKESNGGGDGRKEKDEDDGDDKKKENNKETEKGEDSDNADESEEDADDEDEEDGEKKGDTKTKETSEKGESIEEEEEGSSKVKSGSEEKCEEELPKESPKTEKSKAEKTRSPGKGEGSKETNKDKGKEVRRPVRRSKRWSEDDGSEEYIPKGLNWDEEGSEDEGDSIARSRGRRGQSKPRTEVKVYPIESQVKKTNEVKCGKCDFKGPRQEFERHNLMTHYLLGWIEGEKEVDMNDEEEVKALLKSAFKVIKRAVCDVCKETKRSYMGFLSHIQSCGKSETEKEALKVACPECSAKFSKYGIKGHLYRIHGIVDGSDVNQDVDTDRDQSVSKVGNQRKEKLRSHRNEGDESDNSKQESGPLESILSSSKRKSALRAATKFQEVFKDSVELEEEEEDENANEPGYFFYEKGGKLPKLCSKLRNSWYALKRNKEVIPCHHQNCTNISIDVKEATLHHFTCPLLPSKTYFCESCDYYSVDESEVQSHVKSIHKKTKESKQDADMDFEDNEDADVYDEEPEEEEEGSAEESFDDSDDDFEESDSLYGKQSTKKTNNTNKNKSGESEKKAVKKRNDSESDEEMSEGAHKQNFCEREKLENVRGDEFYSNALEMTRELEESCSEEEEEEEESESSEEETEDEEDSETDNSGVWPQLHTESDDWCGVTREVSSVHLPELLESISICFVKGDSKEFNWRRFKRFEGDIVDGVPALFVGGSVRALSWCKVSFRRALEKSVKQYLAVSTAKNIDHLTDIHRNREFSWSLVQIWDCGALENSTPVHPPKFCLGIFQEGGEIWDMAWLPEDTYGRGSHGRLTRIGILATASDDGSIRIWSICDPSQVVSDSRFPLFITEPLVKLSIDNFLEDSCVRLSLGRDGIIAGGYVNGNLAVWNLNNITSPFCVKLGKCSIIKPHLVIQAHRTSVTALTFCPNNNRYITSGGLDRIVKLWDLESPWVPVEQYQRELCLDNIWPKNWPMNIYNYDEVYPNNRKGVVRFVKGVVSSKHSPCLILDNTCLSLSFSDWLNSLCGCNNTGEVKIRFLKNFLRDQDKKQEKNQSTLSSLRLEKLNGEDDSDWESAPATKDGVPKALPKTYGVLNAQYGIVIKDHDLKDKGSPLTDTFHPEDFPIRAVNKVSFNPNFKSFTHIAVGYNCGLVRIQRLNELQFNNAIKSFSDKSKKPRL